MLSGLLAAEAEGHPRALEEEAVYSVCSARIPQGLFCSQGDAPEGDCGPDSERKHQAGESSAVWPSRSQRCRTWVSAGWAKPSLSPLFALKTEQACPEARLLPLGEHSWLVPLRPTARALFLLGTVVPKMRQLLTPPPFCVFAWMPWACTIQKTGWGVDYRKPNPPPVFLVAQPGCPKSLAIVMQCRIGGVQGLPAAKESPHCSSFSSGEATRSGVGLGAQAAPGHCWELWKGKEGFLPGLFAPRPTVEAECVCECECGADSQRPWWGGSYVSSLASGSSGGGLAEIMGGREGSSVVAGCVAKEKGGGSGQTAGPPSSASRALRAPPQLHSGRSSSVSCAGSSAERTAMGGGGGRGLAVLLRAVLGPFPLSLPSAGWKPSPGVSPFRLPLRGDWRVRCVNCVAGLTGSLVQLAGRQGLQLDSQKLHFQSPRGGHEPL